MTRTLVGSPDPQRPRNEPVWTNGAGTTATNGAWIEINRKK